MNIEAAHTRDLAEKSKVLVQAGSVVGALIHFEQGALLKLGAAPTGALQKRAGLLV